jgi:hypothetical protein
MELKSRHNIHNTHNTHASLMSPPEATPIDNFNRTSPEQTMSPQKKQSYSLQAGRFPISPPVSPLTKILASEESPSLVTRDPILYPNAESSQVTSAQVSLFDDESVATRRAVMTKHVAAVRQSSLFREASPPLQDHYELALEFQSQIFRKFSESNRREWLNRERAQLIVDQAMRNGMRKYPTLAPATQGSRPRALKGSGPVKANKVIKQPRPPKSPKPPRATPEPGSKRVVREDKDFNSLPDLCPPVSSLPTKPNSLKVEWRGAPIDLRKDPNTDLLHPDELSLAANLRLDCATYLTSKRRIFIARTECLRIGREFRKTDAQQACKIDVNKASKLWQAYEKVGWLHPRWVQNYV